MADPADIFVNSIANNPHIFKNIENVKRRGLIFLIQGIFTLIAGIILSIQTILKKNDMTTKELSEKMWNISLFSKINMIGNGLILLYNATQLVFMYKPSNVEISMSLLIKYLRTADIIPQKVYETLKSFKPYRIGTLKIG